jgi:hypothetical protein
MERKKAIEILEERNFKSMSIQDRRECLEELWICCDGEDWFDEDDFASLPADVKKDMIDNETPSNPGDDRFDFIIRDRIAGIYDGIKNSYLIKLLREIGIDVAKIEGENEKLDKCDCCGYRTITPGEDGICDICPVCFWENWTEGCNRITLEQARKNFHAFGAKSKRVAEYVDPNGKDKYEKDS